MHFLVDVHLPISLSKFLDKQSECSAKHVNHILQKWFTTDSAICKYADENDFVVITKDLDFKASHFVKKSPRKVIRIILGNISNSELLIIFEKYLPFILDQKSKAEFYIEVSKESLSVFYS